MNQLMDVPMNGFLKIIKEILHKKFIIHCVDILITVKSLKIHQKDPFTYFQTFSANINPRKRKITFKVLREYKTACDHK